jgi:hypothetical protein
MTVAGDLLHCSTPARRPPRTSCLHQLGARPCGANRCRARHGLSARLNKTNHVMSYHVWYGPKLRHRSRESRHEPMGGASQGGRHQGIGMACGRLACAMCDRCGYVWIRLGDKCFMEGQHVNLHRPLCNASTFSDSVSTFCITSCINPRVASDIVFIDLL